MTSVLELTQELIRCESITPHDSGCQKIIAKYLTALKFKIEHLRFGDVDNLWARYGTEAPLLVFAGHTDVVPPGPLTMWKHPPFTPTIEKEYLFGRGATDMKSGLAAMIIAAENFIKKTPDFKGSIAFLITSDEEGHSIDGTQKVIQLLESRQEKIQYCIIGEASSENVLGDQIRVGRRGSFSGKLKIFGKQGHIAYPNKENPIHLAGHIIDELSKIEWDQGNEFFPPTTFQMSNIHAGTGALNVIPGILEIDFNFRFSTAVTTETLQKRVTTVLEKSGVNFQLQWKTPSQPFLTKQGKLVDATKKAIHEVVGLETHLSTGGGTSDGRFIAPTGAEVIELGPCNTSAHQVNEHVRVEDLEKLVTVYQRILELVYSI